MAPDGLFFRAFARLHPRFRTPSLAIVLQAAWAIALALTGTYGELIDTVVFADWIFFGLTVASLLVFRRRVPLTFQPAGGFRAPLSPFLPILFAIVSAGVVASVVVSNPVRSAVGAALLLAGVPAYLYWRRRAPTPAEEAKGRGERVQRPRNDSSIRSMNAGAASTSTRLTVQPPNPAPVMRVPQHPGTPRASSTRASSTGVETSKSWRRLS